MQLLSATKVTTPHHIYYHNHKLIKSLLPKQSKPDDIIVTLMTSPGLIFRNTEDILLFWQAELWDKKGTFILTQIKPGSN